MDLIAIGNRITLLARHQVVKKFGRALLVALGVTTVSFSLLRFAPGDPALAVLGDSATLADIEAFREELGLNGPLWRQFIDYVGPLLQGDLGRSVITGQRVNDLIFDSLPVTMALILVAMTIALSVSLPLSVVFARHRQDGVGLVFRIATSASLSIPVFFSGLLLILLIATRVDSLPVGGYSPGFPGNLRTLLLPAITLCGGLIPIFLRVLQSSVAATMEEAFVESALVRGLSGPKLTWRYLLRPSIAPTVALMTYIMGTLLGSAVVIELVFNLPGIGTRLVNAVFSRDYAVVQGVVFVIGMIVVLINFAADVLNGLLDPRAKETI